MKLGILVNTDKHADDVVGITKAAASKDHEVSIFMMDTGVKLIGNASIRDLCSIPNVKVCYCDHSAGILDVSKEGVPDAIVCGSQFDNANMNNEADRVIVL
ncbi:MAG TPA: hypothetical protein ENH40_00680 [Nitrospirae bacterium]|nr:hypothetical protein [Nitrospirota bacterium]